MGCPLLHASQSSILVSIPFSLCPFPLAAIHTIPKLIIAWLDSPKITMESLVALVPYNPNGLCPARYTPIRSTCHTNELDAGGLIQQFTARGKNVEKFHVQKS